MAIVAVLSTIGVSALIATKNNSLVDANAEELVTNIRLAQNNAVSIKEGGCDPTITEATTKVWGVSVTASGFKLDHYCNDTGDGLRNGLSKRSSAELSPYTGAAYSFSGPGVNYSSSYVYFSTPFGKGSNYDTELGSTDWAVKQTQQQDWAGTGITPVDVNIKISRGSYSRIVVVKANGDAYVE